MPQAQQSPTVTVRLPSGKLYDIPRENLVRAKSLGAVEYKEPEAPAPEGTATKVARGAALGAFSGAGIAETKSPVSDTLAGLREQFATMMGGKAWKGEDPYGIEAIKANPIIAIPRNLVKGGSELAEDVLESGTSYGNIKLKKNIDPEKLSHDVASLFTQLATLGLFKKAATADIAEGAVARGTRTGAREILGVGEKQVERAKKTADTAAAEKMAEYNEKKAKYDAKVAEAKAEHEAKMAKKQAEHEAAVVEAKAKHQADLDAAEQSLAGRVSKEAHARLKESRLNKATKTLTDYRDKLVKQATENMDKAEANERKSLDSRYEDFRKKVLGVSEANPNGTLQSELTPVGQAVLDAKKNILKGSRTNITIFNDIMGRLKDLIEAPDGTVKPLEGQMIATDQLRGYYKELGDAIYEKDLPGDVRQALKSVQDKIHSEVKSAIKDNHGQAALDVYDKLSEDWAAYKRVWYDRSSGSPLPRILRTIRSPVALHEGVNVEGPVADLLARKHAGNAVTTILARKAQFGADPAVIARLGAVSKKLAGIQDLYETIPVAKYPRFPKLEVPKAPEREPFKARGEEPERPKTEPFSAPKYRREIIGKEVEQMSRLNFWDVAAITGAIEELIRDPEHLGKAAGIASYPLIKRLLARGIESRPVMDWLSGEGETGKPSPPSYRPSEKAQTMSGERKSLGKEFEAGERTHEIDRYKRIMRDPNATSEDRVIALQRLIEMGVAP